MYTSVRGVDPHDAREPKLASLLVAARWPLQHPSCRHRHRCRLHRPKQSVCRLVDRIERPSRASLTFDAPHTELIPGIPEGTVAGTCWTGRSSSREIVRCPSSDVLARVHSPRAYARVRTAVCRPRFSFRPCGISPLRRFPPQRKIRACCIPVPDMGFAGLQGSRRHHPKANRTRSSFPPALHPSKVCSSSVAVPHRWGLLPS